MNGMGAIHEGSSMMAAALNKAPPPCCGGNAAATAGTLFTPISSSFRREAVCGSIKVIREVIIIIIVLEYVYVIRDSAIAYYKLTTQTPHFSVRIDFPFTSSQDSQ